MRGMVLAGAVGLLLAVSADAQERPRTVRVHSQASGWYGSSYGAYWRLDVAGRPLAMRSRSFAPSNQPYANAGWTTESEDFGGYSMPPYYSLSREPYQRSWRGYIILPPNFADDDKPETKGR